CCGTWRSHTFFFFPSLTYTLVHINVFTGAAMSEAYSPVEETINSLTHCIGAVLSVVGTFLLLMPAIVQQGVWKVVGFGVFGTCLALLYTAPTRLHGARQPPLRKIY